MKIDFKVKEGESYTLVHFELEGNITPEILREIKPPKVVGTRVLYCQAEARYGFTAI